jgi:serine/threonine-protein kinase
VVPPLAGQPPAQAEQALKALGLVPARGADVFSSTVAAGLVAVTNPAQGASVPKGSTVTYQVSKGADLVTVPAVAGLSLQQATAALTAAGLTVGPLVGDRTKPVAAATPATGSTVARGSAVGLTFFP